MTVIAAMYRGGRAWIAADSRVTFGCAYRDDAQKLYRFGLPDTGVVIGVCGAFVLHRPIAKAEPPPANADAKQIEEWFTALSDAQRQWAKEQGHGEICNMMQNQDVWMLLASRVGLWRTDPAGAVMRIGRDWEAIGSGSAEASGSIVTSLMVDRQATPEAVLTRAVRVACSLDTSCGGEPSWEMVG